uniref:uncharacterized protein LOC131129913 n=1 Tax=Doryrhamphus excisus TaxID=161450 RepID=UPI0025AE50B7|nr:uncharacterized protein LOC131129913 [Doryrhamphus excisus]XP_057929840.1 uncharacterized protein LOC131129913 [Doryrhamphus excisus]XP_057929841.1 uncharacterized protein LOC131129913 [Doryrhamphus excisus]
MINDRKGGWETLVADPQGYDWSSYTKTSYAKHQRPLMSLVEKNQGKTLVLTVDLTSGQLLSPIPTKDTSCVWLGCTCWEFLLCQWRTGYDTCYPIQLCQTYSAKLQRPELTRASIRAGVKVAVLQTTDDWFQVFTGISGQNNNWLLMAEQAANTTNQDCVVCMGPRPLLQIVPSVLNKSCLLQVMTKTNPTGNCAIFDKVFPLTGPEKKKPLFSNKVAMGNFTCIHRTGTGNTLGSLNVSLCVETETVDVHFSPLSRSDIWWWCGGNAIYDKLPFNTTGYCATVTLILPVHIFQITAVELLHTFDTILPHLWTRTKRGLGWSDNDPTYIDAIGIPRGVPDDYKLVNQIAAGWESIVPWITINKNVDRINYIHYNVQKLGNYTQDGFQAIHEQLSATSLMAFQNRIALDMLLAEKGHVCALFGEKCCTFIPNNTAADGSLTRALDGLQSLNKKMKEHSGVDTSMWSGFADFFSKWKPLLMTIALAVTVFVSILTVCGCICIPIFRRICTQVISSAISPIQLHVQELYTLIPQHDDDEDGVNINKDSVDHDDETSFNITDLFPDPGDYE